MEIVYTVALVVAISALLTFIGLRNKRASWAGTVTNVRLHRFQRDESDEEEYIIKYRTDQGKKRKIKLSVYAFNKFYGGLKAGDRLVKESGEYMPKVVSE